ncbi:MAG: hypothetical protein ACLRTQ_01250 [Candidatus Borkfalkia sp.]
MHKLLKRTMAIDAPRCPAGVGCSGEKETISSGWNDIASMKENP